MLAAVYFASFVDIVLLKCILIVSSPAVLVLVFLSNLSLSPPTVSLVWLMSSFCSQMSQQKRTYVIFFPMGSFILHMKLVISDLCTRCLPSLFLPTPFNSFPNPFADDFLPSFTCLFVEVVDELFVVNCFQVSLLYTAIAVCW